MVRALLAALLLPSLALGQFAQVPDHRALAARAPTTSTDATSAGATSGSTASPSRTTSAAATGATPSTGTATVTGSMTGTMLAPAMTVSGQIPFSPLASLVNIGTATTSELTSALPSTYAAGATAFPGAPPLPAIYALNPAMYPALDRQPPVDSPQVLEWISKVNLAGAPKIAVNGINGCQNTSVNAAAIAAAGTNGNCWWTCGGCTRATDISYCPNKLTWGLSYDDGPSPYTPRLLTLLAAQNIKSTFFIVGSRAISRPQMLQTEYMEGHQLSVHTWAHPPLTTMTNEQIVAELGWTKKIIKDVTGVTPNTMRPPYGDIDDRVRYISLQMGLTPIIWTAADGNTFDTRDWQIGNGIVNSTTVYNNFESYLGKAATTLKTGFIVLAHDLYQQSVELAVDYILPNVLNSKVLKLQPIITCLGMDISQAYIETSNNLTSPVEITMTLVGASGSGFVKGVESTSVISTSAAGSTSTGSSSTKSGASTAYAPTFFASLLAAAMGYTLA